MNAQRVWVRNNGVTKQVAATAVPVLAPGGWAPLTKAEVAEHEKQLLAERDARHAALTPASAEPAPEPEPAPKKSGAKRPGSAPTDDTSEES